VTCFSKTDGIRRTKALMSRRARRPKAPPRADPGSLQLSFFFPRRPSVKPSMTRLMSDSIRYRIPLINVHTIKEKPRMMEPKRAMRTSRITVFSTKGFGFELVKIFQQLRNNFFYQSGEVNQRAPFFSATFLWLRVVIWDSPNDGCVDGNNQGNFRW